MTATIQHCRISSKFDMWVDNDVQLLNSRIQIEQLRHDQVDGIFPVLKITLP